MNFELYYTSAPRGLRPGTKGICTVACTVGMPRSLVDRLESWSGYSPASSCGLSHPAENPPLYAHRRVVVGGTTCSVLSRVGFCGYDYTGRPNHLAYHAVLDPSEQSPAGPAWTLNELEIRGIHWQGEPRYLPPGLTIPRKDGEQGDDERVIANWARMLADSFVSDSREPVFLVWDSGTSLLPFLIQVNGLLPQQLRWQATFGMFLSDLPAHPECLWRCCAAGSAAAKAARLRQEKGLLLDLTKPWEL